MRQFITIPEILKLPLPSQLSFCFLWFNTQQPMGAIKTPETCVSPAFHTYFYNCKISITPLLHCLFQQTRVFTQNLVYCLQLFG